MAQLYTKGGETAALGLVTRTHYGGYSAATTAATTTATQVSLTYLLSFCISFCVAFASAFASTFASLRFATLASDVPGVLTINANRIFN